MPNIPPSHRKDYGFGLLFPRAGWFNVPGKPVSFKSLVTAYDAMVQCCYLRGNVQMLAETHDNPIRHTGLILRHTCTGTRMV